MSDLTMFLIFIGVVCGPVILFLGPTMWSSSNEFAFVTLWRWIRRRKKTGAQDAKVLPSAYPSETDRKE